MKILAIHDGHNASCCYLEHGEIQDLALEERFTQKKNQSGYPHKSIEWVLNRHSLAFSDLDCVVFPHLTPPVCFDQESLEQYTPLRVFHMLLCEVMPKRIIGSNHLVSPYVRIFSQFRRNTIKKYAKANGIPIDKIKQVEHHIAHGYAALYGSGFMNEKEPIIIFTADNSGDGLSSTVSAWDSSSGFRRIHINQSFNSIGELYSRVTEYLGMRMAEHEYKVMGMAPYADGRFSERTHHILSRYICLDNYGLAFRNKKTYGYGLLQKMKKDLFRHRFDSICYAMQKVLEDLVVTWVANWCKKTGIRRAVFGGGVFMNVKLNLLLTELPELDNVYFFPSSSDESTAIGAGYYANEKWGGEAIKPLGPIYKGPDYSDDEIERSLAKFSDKVVYKKENDIEWSIAKLISEGNIVGRFQGRSEWGARALGNRSICCRADDLRIITKLNKAVKRRDFWMPFAPSILEEDVDNYVVNTKNIFGPYMMVAFYSKSLAQKHFPAALHPYDKTCRPHVVRKEWNPRYHKLLTLFKNLTGIGAILNTSFNLHGWPIVNSPDDALRTLINSGLDYVAIENYLIRAKPNIQSVN